MYNHPIRENNTSCTMQIRWVGQQKYRSLRWVFLWLCCCLVFFFVDTSLSPDVFPVIVCLPTPLPAKDNVLMSFSNDENQNWTKYFNGVGLTIATYKDNISVFLLCTAFFCVLCFTRLTLIFVLLTCTLLYSITAFHLIAKKTVSTLPGCIMFNFFLELMFSSHWSFICG